MANFRKGLMILFVVFATTAMVVRSSSNGFQFDKEADGHGLVADNLDLDEMFMMESDSARRQLAQGGYISYGALRRNKVPCNRRGQSYYNCRSHQKVNPYHRGCTRATYCARNNN